jgi:hypothetical protein
MKFLGREYATEMPNSKAMIQAETNTFVRRRKTQL